MHSNITTVIPFVVIDVPFVGSFIRLNGTTIVPFVAIVVPFAGSLVHLNETTVIPFVAIFVPSFQVVLFIRKETTIVTFCNCSCCCSFPFKNNDFSPTTCPSDTFIHSVEYELH
jgi:hypothetical protein